MINESYAVPSGVILALVRKRKGRRITLSEARQIALRAMDLTDRLLADDKDREVERLRRSNDAD